jgi:hypothetical protein
MYPLGRLLDAQVMRLYNLNPARGGTSAFPIVFNNCGDVHELGHQVVRRFVRSERLNRVEQHDELCHGARIIKKV